MIARLHDILWTPKPYERKVLLCLAAWRALWTAGVAIGLSSLGWSQPVLSWLPTVPNWAPPLIVTGRTVLGTLLAALFSADWIEHYAKQWLLGYTYAPGVMANDEWEGGMTYLAGDTPEQTETYRTLWEAHKLDVFYYKDAAGAYQPCVFWGDPGSGHYGPDQETR